MTEEELRKDIEMLKALERYAIDYADWNFFHNTRQEYIAILEEKLKHNTNTERRDSEI